MRCKKCGKECLDLDSDGLCPDCADEDSDDEEMSGEEMDDFATCIINSHLNPGI